MEALLPGSKIKILILLLIIAVSVLFLFSLFKNIGFPLLWHDESETAMFATRVLEYGYPKVHDGKNIVYLLAGFPMELGIKKGSDAYIGTTWGHFYVSAAGEFFARNVDDIYAKTALLRIPFALLGIIGLALIAACFFRFFGETAPTKLFFLFSFFLLELVSVSLILHLRQVRYYSIVIFLSACIFYIYINHTFFRKINRVIYALLLTVLLLLLFATFTPVYFVFVATFGIYECLRLLQRRDVKAFFVDMAPLIFACIATIPLMVFFDSFHIMGKLSKEVGLDFSLQFDNIRVILTFFQKYEFLYAVLAVKIILGALCLYHKGAKNPRRYSKVKSMGQDAAIDAGAGITIEQRLRVSNFLTLFFVVYIGIVTRVPLFVLFQRYFIMLQPFLIVILLLDMSIIASLCSRISSLRLKRGTVTGIVLLLTPLLLLTAGNKAEYIKNYIYELSHQYRGPLDFVIPFIKAHYEHPERLVIATNYEECSYMYYLKSKVIIGYAGLNADEEVKMRPDIIIFRQKRTPSGIRPFNAFLQKAKYRRIYFPVFDSPVNNIPEIDFPYEGYSHLYRTKMAREPEKRLYMGMLEEAYNEKIKKGAFKGVEVDREREK